MSTTYRSNGSSVNGGESLRLSQEQDERSFGQIVSDLTSHGRELMKGEVALVKREMSDNAKSLAKPIAMFAAAGVVGLVALILLGHTIAWALNEVLDPWGGYLVAFALFAITAGILALVGKKALAKAQLAPTNSIEEAKEDLTWIKEHAR